MGERLSALLRLVFWGACAAIAVASLLPGPWLPPAAFDLWDKAQHGLAFLLLAVLGFGAFPGAVGRVALGLLAYGVAIELAQAATGWRYGDGQDWLADAVGVLAGYLMWGLGRAVTDERRKAECDA